MRLGRAVWVACLAAVLLAAAGCGEKSDKQVMKSEVLSGGSLVYGSLQEPNTLNPYLSDRLATAETARLIFSGLLVMNDKGEWIPDLAQEVPSLKNGSISADGLTVTYKLKPGILWHDGVPFTSGDVKFTWEFIMNRQASVVSREGYDKIDTIETPDSQTVIIRFHQPYPQALSLFPAVLPRHLLGQTDDVNKAAFNRAPVGTGPFIFKEWRIAETIELAANPRYFRGRPKLDRISYKIIPDMNILLTQLKAGEVDVAGNISFTQLEQIKALNMVKTVTTPSLIWEHLDFNLDREYLRDSSVRQAIALGLDRQAIVSAALKGAAFLAVSDQAPVSWALNPELKPTARDTNAARELLKQAGWSQGADGVFIKHGQRLSFGLTITTGNRIRETVAQIISQQLREIGAEVEINPIEPKALPDMLRFRRFDTVLYAWVEGVDPDHFTFWNSQAIPSAFNGYAGQNYSGWRNPEVDALTAQASRSADIEVRRQAYYRLQEILTKEWPVIPLYFRATIDAVKPTVVNYKPSMEPAGNLWNAWEWALTVKK